MRTSVSLLANEFDVQSVLYGQVSLAAVNHIYVFHEVMNGCKNLKIHYRLALKIYMLKLTVVIALHIRQNFSVPT